MYSMIREPGSNPAPREHSASMHGRSTDDDAQCRADGRFPQARPRILFRLDPSLGEGRTLFGGARHFARARISRRERIASAKGGLMYPGFISHRSVRTAERRVFGSAARPDAGSRGRAGAIGHRRRRTRRSPRAAEASVFGVRRGFSPTSSISRTRRSPSLRASSTRSRPSEPRPPSTTAARFPFLPRRSSRRVSTKPRLMPEPPSACNPPTSSAPPS